MDMHLYDGEKKTIWMKSMIYQPEVGFPSSSASPQNSSVVILMYFRISQYTKTNRNTMAQSAASPTLMAGSSVVPPPPPRAKSSIQKRPKTIVFSRYQKRTPVFWVFRVNFKNITLTRGGRRKVKNYVFQSAMPTEV